MKPLISIIIPIYNIESLVERCLTSAANQTYTNIEVIIVDDCSTDNSAAVAQNYCLLDSRFRLVKQATNSGAGAARNRGILESRGEYVCFVDGDDMISPYYVENLWHIIEKTGSDIAITRIFITRDLVIDNHYEFSDTRDFTPEVWSSDDALKQLFLHYIHCGFVCKLYKKEKLLKLPISEDRYYEDMDWIYKIFLNANLVAIGEVKDYFYIHRSGSLSNSKHTEKQLDLFLNAKDCVNMITEKRPQLKSYAAFYVWGHLRHQLFTNYKNLGEYDRLFFNEARSYCFSAFKVAYKEVRIWMIIMTLGYPMFKWCRDLHFNVPNLKK